MHSIASDPVRFSIPARSLPRLGDGCHTPSSTPSCSSCCKVRVFHRAKQSGVMKPGEGRRPDFLALNRLACPSWRTRQPHGMGNGGGGTVREFPVLTLIKLFCCDLCPFFLHQSNQGGNRGLSSQERGLQPARTLNSSVLFHRGKDNSTALDCGSGNLGSRHSGTDKCHWRPGRWQSRVGLGLPSLLRVSLCRQMHVRGLGDLLLDARRSRGHSELTVWRGICLARHRR